MFELPAGLGLCLLAIAIAVFVAATLPAWAQSHPSKRERRIMAERSYNQLKHRH